MVGLDAVKNFFAAPPSAPEDDDREAMFAAASFAGMDATPAPPSGPQAIDVSTLGAYHGSIGGGDGYQAQFFDGGKFVAGFGATKLITVDYWTLRARSHQLFTENLYARGIIRRLITNEINTGLTPETMLDESILGMSDDGVADWSERIESRFSFWGKDARVCDWKGKSTFGELQRFGRMEALVGGDVLVVLRHSRKTRLPQVQLVQGSKVTTPALSVLRKLRKDHHVKHGVELDKNQRIVAFYIRQDDGKTHVRIPAFGERSGRRMAWLVYGTDKRVDEVRGQPLLSLMLQSLKEIDRYRDSAQRQAVVNSVLAMFIQKDTDKLGSLPVTGGAIRRDGGTVQDADGGTRTFTIAQQVPGMVIEELQVGEKPVAFTNGTDIDFAAFETAIINGIAWANEIPPEILTLSFNANYSASQAALNEFKAYLNLIWGTWGEAFCQPIYVEWLVSETLLRNITAPGLIEAWRNPRAYEVFGAWVRSAWYGSVKPTTDPLKQVKASGMLVAQGWSNNAREARHLTGTTFRQNIKRLKRENKMKVEALRPLAEFDLEMGITSVEDDSDEGGAQDLKAQADAIAATQEQIEALEENANLT